MRQLLETKLAEAYASTKKIIVHEEVESGEFGITDTKSCRDCENCTSYFYRTCESRFVSLHQSENPVSIICIEDIFQQFPNIKALSQGGCCDVLMSTQEKIVVMDTTCLRPEYVAGKRAYAYKQLNDSIRKLRKAAAINSRINSYESRIAICALKEKRFGFEGATNSVSKNMRSFMRMADDFKSRATLQTDMGNGFYFIVQNYPEVFQW